MRVDMSIKPRIGDWNIIKSRLVDLLGLIKFC